MLDDLRVRDTEIFRRLMPCEPLAAAAREMTGAVRLYSPCSARS